MKQLLLIMALMLLAVPAFADCPDPALEGTICVEWDAPDENVDGTPIPASGPGSIASYRLFWSLTQGSFSIGDSVLITNPDLRELTVAEGEIIVPRPPEGGTVPLFLVMTATNTLGESSAFSATVARDLVFPRPVPGEPTILEVTVPIIFSVGG